MTEAEITLAEIAATDLGKEIIGQRDVAAKTEADAAERNRKSALKIVEPKVKAALTAVVDGRDEAMEFARHLIEAAGELYVKFEALKNLRKQALKLGGNPPNMPESLTCQRSTQLFLHALTAAVNKFGRSL